MWASGPIGNDDARTAETIVEWLTEEGFTLMNKKGEITHPPRSAQERPSVINLTFINRQAIQAGTVKEWAIDPGLAHDTDYLGIKFLIAHGQMEINNLLDIKYCLKDVKLDEWTKELEKAIIKSQETLQPLLSPDPLPPHNLNQSADALTDALQMATAATAKIHQLCTNTKPWWDNDLTQAAERVSEAQKEQKHHLNTLNSFNSDIRTCIRKARNFFKRLCRIKKHDWINKKLQQATTDNIWGFQNWLKGTRNYPTPPISRGTNTPKAITHQEKCDVLRNELYQPPPQLEEEHNPDLANPHADDLPVLFDAPQIPAGIALEFRVFSAFIKTYFEIHLHRIYFFFLSYNMVTTCIIVLISC